MLAMAPAPPPQVLARALASADAALRQNRLGEAEAICRDLTQQAPDFTDGWMAYARVRQKAGDYAGMRGLAERAIKASGGHPRTHLLDVEALIHLGEVRAARGKLAKLKPLAKGDVQLLMQISDAFSQIGHFDDAAKLARDAATIKPDEPGVLYALATALVATGDLDGAEDAYDRLIRANPYDFDAYYNRATLRKQTAAHNHLDEIDAMLASDKGARQGVVQLNYARAKELEDLGRYPESFTALKAGADARRKAMAYRVEGDVTTMAALARAFDAGYFAKAGAGFDEEGPIFVLGLPRSGTTLIDRILSAHSDVESLGEIIDFAMSLMALAGEVGGKAGLIDASTRIDPRALGERYVARARQRGQGARLFIDKTPVNFLYIGLIAAALPNARIVHVERGAMDCAFAMYKQLFRMGYPFSYDFADLAAYMKAKEKLMAHWRAVLPGRLIELRYEDLIADQEGESRKLVEAVGLDWQDACLRFHENTSASATASAAQVRQPLYTSAVERWRKYENELAPLAELLEVQS